VRQVDALSPPPSLLPPLHRSNYKRPFTFASQAIEEPVPRNWALHMSSMG
jgi:hypothetical protein